MRAHRFPITVLFTYIVGSTERAAALGDRRWGELLARYQAVARAEIKRFGGQEVHMAGGGFLAIFEAPAAGMRSAWAVQVAVRELGLEVRCGMHAGEVEGHGKHVEGIALNIGARVATAARPGQILVMSTVRELVTETGFAFEDRGEAVLKGVPGAWRLFALEGPPAGAAFRTRRWVPEISAHQAKMLGMAAFGVAALGVLGVVIVGDMAKRAPSRAGMSAERAFGVAAPGIAVVPFRVTNPELGLWREGMVDLLSTNLDGAGGL
jgi:class 3 adenylate cyclase